MDTEPTHHVARGLPRFRLGISLAGGVSTGCYVAGVLDFIVEALDAWEAERLAGKPDAPRHEVIVESFAGTSAGAETGALLALALRSRFPHVRLRPNAEDPPDAHQNPMYAGWVRGATIHDLLGSKDWSDGAFRSVLDGSCTDTIGEKARALPQTLSPIAGTGRTWLADPLRMAFTITNLDGVLLRAAGPGGPVPSFRLHADAMRFALTGLGGAPSLAPRRDEMPLAYPAHAADLPVQWKVLTDAAAASGAFPVVLPTRVVPWMTDAYTPVRASLPSGTPPPSSAEFSPLWRAGSNSSQVRFVAADGGVLVNDPVDIVRDNLFRPPVESEERADSAPDSAILLVHPLLDRTSAEAPPDARERDARPHRLLMLLAAAVRNHARVTPAIIALAQREDVYSHYMIAPARPGKPGEPTSAALASSSVWAFGGYLHSDYRRHDFQLGRRNAQYVLRRYMTLPESHPLFHEWSPAQRERYRVHTARGPELPIIPLVGLLLDEEEPALAWPTSLRPTERLAGPLDVRLSIVAKGLLMAYLPRCPLFRAVLHGGWRVLFARAARNGILAAMRKSLNAHGL